VFDEPASWERLKDMLRKLCSLSARDEAASYDATCLVVVDWQSGDVVLDDTSVPDDLSPDRFFATTLRRLFSRSPVSEHARARQLWAASGRLTRPCNGLLRLARRSRKPALWLT
jgi:hypothetical protein